MRQSILTILKVAARNAFVSQPLIETAHPENCPEFYPEISVKVNEEAPTSQKIKSIVMNFWNCKSGGTDKINSVFLNYAESELLLVLA